MNSSEFKKWRKGNKFSQTKASEKLGLKRRMIQYYEKVTKGDKLIKIPKYIKLACQAVDYQKEQS